MKKVQKKISSKYITVDLDEFQPGSRRKVLKNKLGIIKIKEIDDAEFKGYYFAERELIKIFKKDQKFTLNDLHLINKIFLGNIYEWAGKTRTVNISKGNFIFATTFGLIRLLPEFEKNVLFKNTPCQVRT